MRSSAFLFFFVVSCSSAGQSATTSDASTDGPADASVDAGAHEELAYTSFVINTHDWVNPSQSADTLLRLVGIFEKYKVRGEFYFTAPVVDAYVAQRPDVIARFKSSNMTISYHIRAPHALYQGFQAPLQGKTGSALSAILKDYETYKLNLTDASLDKTKSGGFKRVAEAFDKKPFTISVSNVGPDDAIQASAMDVYQGIGAKGAIVFHTGGTDPKDPLTTEHGLLVRPSDLGVSDFKVGNDTDYWWYRLIDPSVAAQWEPLTNMQSQLGAWTDKRKPFVAVLIHENNFKRTGSEPFNSIYHVMDGQYPKGVKPSPWDLSTPDVTTSLTSEQSEAIFAAYERMVAWASQHTRVVTMEDIAVMDESKL